MANSPQQICAALEKIAGTNDVICQPEGMAVFLEEPRKRFHTAAMAVVTPRDIKTLQALAAWANAKKQPLIAQGGNTGLVGGSVPHEHGREVLVNLGRLNRIRDVDPVNHSLTAEAGCILADIQAAAAGENYEWTRMYPEFGKVAREEGLEHIANVFESIAVAERQHEKRYSALLTHIENGTVFKKDEPVVWICQNCGYVHVSAEAPTACPACAHPQAYFEVLAENW